MKVLSEQELKARLVQKRAEKNNDTRQTSALVQSQDLADENGEQVTEQDTTKTIKNYLLGLLARREYSAFELAQKAKTKGFDSEVTQVILKDFQEQGLQSDSRFCELYIRSRVARLIGPFKLRMELKAKGVSDLELESALSRAECDWFDLAVQAAHKKTLSWQSFDFNDKGKLMRFLQGKGFEQEQIRYAVEEIDRSGQTSPSP